MALDITLGDELFLTFDSDGEVDVRCARPVGHGLDGAEHILAVGSSEESSEALEVTIPLGRIAGLGVEIGAVVVRLPNLDQSVTHGVAVFVEDATGQPSDLTDRWRDTVVQDDQVVIGIERQLVGIKRPLGLLRRARQRLGERAGDREQRRPQSHLTEEITTGTEIRRQRG